MSTRRPATAASGWLVATMPLRAMTVDRLELSRIYFSSAFEYSVEGRFTHYSLHGDNPGPTLVKGDVRRVLRQ